MSDLPADHVPGIRSFDGVGSNFVGPFLVRTSTLRNAKIVRAYLCVFVCLLTKVVNLVSSLSTPAFVATLDRFISWRGLLSLIRSDCGNNYWGTSNYLKEEYAFLTANQNKISTKLTQRGISWLFDPPAFPHNDGIFEAVVNSAKTRLRRVIEETVLTLRNLLWCSIKLRLF